MFAYSDHGQTMRAIGPGMEAPGEVVFDHYATEGQLLVAFPGRAAVLAEESRKQTESELTATLQTYMDDEAKTRNYDGILSLCSYAASPHPKFGHEGMKGLSFRDAVWSYGYQVMADVTAGKRVAPTKEELLAGAPRMEW